MEDFSDYDENLEYAKKKIELARLEESEICPVIQSLSIDEDQEDLYVLQLNDCVLKQIEEGKVLTIRGEPTDTAVICTDSSTFEFREAETSNSLLVLPELCFPGRNEESGHLTLVPRAICGIFHSYFELRNYNPNFKKLRLILGRNPFKGREYENSEMKNYTFEELLDIVQASEAELKKALDDLQTCVIDGFVRILDFNFKFNLICQIVHVVESRSIPIDKIPKEEVLEALQDDVHIDMVEKCFDMYTYEISDTNENGSMLYAFHNDLVCQAYAEFLLHDAGKFDLSQFLKSWQKSIPDGMKCDLSQLRGLAITDMNSRPEAILYFPLHELPENLTDRFNKLFKAKEKWTYDEIVPYLNDKAVAGTDVKSLLVKYTRESIRDGVKLYSSKW